MADLDGDPRCNFCRHLASSHTYEAAPDLSVPCAACPGGRCPPPEAPTGEWAQNVSDGTPTLRAGTVIEAPASLAEAIEDIEARRRS